MNGALSEVEFDSIYTGSTSTSMGSSDTANLICRPEVV